MRLEGAAEELANAALEKFQFLIGAIGRLSIEELLKGLLMFQFLIGAIGRD